MPKVYCCNCSRRTDNKKDRTRIGTPTVWPLFLIHVEKNGLDVSSFSADDYICKKCYSTVSHYRMNDRGTNKKIKDSKPFVFEPSITKTALRNFSKSMNSIETSSETSIEISSELLATITRNEMVTGKTGKT